MTSHCYFFNFPFFNNYICLNLAHLSHFSPLYHIFLAKNPLSRFGFLSGHFVFDHSLSSWCLLLVMAPWLFLISCKKSSLFFSSCMVSLVPHLISYAGSCQLALCLFLKFFFYLSWCKVQILLLSIIILHIHCFFFGCHLSIHIIIFLKHLC